MTSLIDKNTGNIVACMSDEKLREIVDWHTDELNKLYDLLHDVTEHMMKLDAVLHGVCKHTGMLDPNSFGEEGDIPTV
jgi:hypothetical protein